MSYTDLIFFHSLSLSKNWDIFERNLPSGGWSNWICDLRYLLSLNIWEYARYVWLLFAIFLLRRQLMCMTNSIQSNFFFCVIYIICVQLCKNFGKFGHGISDFVSSKQNSMQPYAIYWISILEFYSNTKWKDRKKKMREAALDIQAGRLIKSRKNCQFGHLYLSVSLEAK